MYGVWFHDANTVITLEYIEHAALLQKDIDLLGCYFIWVPKNKLGHDLPGYRLDPLKIVFDGTNYRYQGDEMASQAILAVNEVLKGPVEDQSDQPTIVSGPTT